MNRLYLITGVLLTFAFSLGALIHEHDVRIRSDERAALARRHADSVDASVIPLQRALADSIAALARVHAADSAGQAAAVTQWAAVTHPPKVVVRVDTLPGRVDTIFAEGIPRLPQVVQAGNELASKCTQAEASCARKALALERDTTLMAQRIAALEAMKGATPAPRSCVGPALLGGLLGGVLGGTGGYVAGNQRQR